MKVGIIGHGTDKFTADGVTKAKEIIYSILNNKDVSAMISGHSPVGGIDIWAEEIACRLNVPLELKIPKQRRWNAEYGYKQRNLDIAKCSDVLYVILVVKYPSYYKGMKFNMCYHCGTSEHVKSGACWTAKQARKLGKKVIYYLVENT
jgi:hypothetical protein